MVELIVITNHPIDGKNIIISQETSAKVANHVSYLVNGVSLKDMRIINFFIHVS